MSLAPVCLIDASIYIFRYYFSMPPNWFCQDNGYSTETVYGYTNFLLGFMERHNPRWVAACFDESLGSGFRHQLSPDYKASRALPDEALAFQLEACKTATQLLGLRTFASDAYEADDLLASLYRDCAADEGAIALLSRDKDLGQVLTREQDFLWDYSGDRKHYLADIETRFGVSSAQMADLQALVGDPSDDIAGVPGVGLKTAAALLNQGRSLQQLLQNPQQIADFPIRGARTLAVKVAQFTPQIELALSLVTLKADLALISERNDISRRVPDILAFTDFCQRMGWPAVAKRAQRLIDVQDEYQ
ncbi:5'-3' exonuclease H3TH domain-containing protein [Gilvimarinus sp. DA14]|uniref:5'-3' exonuclease n=1 Tax=Gilvimarinus sp. DA14 TaxID=2956798 RepID=UPI0020B7BC5A|nr:5'-3' exonuclease H3TH domain-containing protein [Gilvimarinus sp. DA14]UTF61376.1 flap endonuclease [Gilvimarinus sp. DA14]